MSLPLPLPPDLPQLKTQARDLLRGHQKGDRDCCRRLRALPEFVALSDDAILRTKLLLKTAQQVIAREYGFEDWMALQSHVESANEPVVERLAEAHQAIVTGDVDVLRDVLQAEPSLVGQRVEGNTLLHTAANNNQGVIGIQRRRCGCARWGRMAAPAQRRRSRECCDARCFASRWR